MDPPPPEIILYFDGAISKTAGDEDIINRNGREKRRNCASALGVVGIGGAAAIIQTNDDEHSTYRVSNRMGRVEKSCAEYYGLILGLRELMHLFPDAPYNLIIKGDSVLVLKHLSQQYNNKSKMRRRRRSSLSTQQQQQQQQQQHHEQDNVLKNYYLVALGLLNQISQTANSIDFVRIHRDLNQQADALAKSASAKKRIAPPYRYFHYSCLCDKLRFLDATIVGQDDIFPAVKVAYDHDPGGGTTSSSRSPDCFVDATTLREVNGDAALEQLQSSGRKNLIEGKAKMTVLGKTSLKVSFGRGLITIRNVLVVDFLPWPLQISMYHPDIINNNNNDDDANVLDNTTTPTTTSKSRVPPADANDNKTTIIQDEEDWFLALPARFRRHNYWSQSQPESATASSTSTSSSQQSSGRPYQHGSMGAILIDPMTCT